jgi:hypothetical protein
MKEENALVITALLILGVLAFATIGYLAYLGKADGVINQIVLIPVSIVSGLGGYLTKGILNSKKQLPEIDK